MNTRNHRLSICLLFVMLLAASSRLRADGFIVIPRPPHPHPVSPFPLEIVYHKVNVDIQDLWAITTVEQEFFNPNNSRLEGYYLFPIPAGATIKQFSMWIDGKQTEAELLDSTKARLIYEDIVRRMRDPALLEYDGRGVFKVRIFPIEPRSTKKIRISYQEVLTRETQRWEYVYPLNTEKFSSKPLREVSIHISIRSSAPLKTVYCPTHEVRMERQGAAQATVTYVARETRPDTDFRLILATERQAVGMSLLSYHKGDVEGYFFLDISPGFDFKGQKALEKDIVFVLDVSGSMAGTSLKQAKRALRFCLENLNPGDRFQVIRFSTEAEALFANLEEATEGNRKSAHEFVENLKAIGGTNIEEALRMALSLKKSDRRPFMLIFITDGKPTIGETDEARLVATVDAANNDHTRIFTFGIGEEINTHLLDKFTEFSRGYRSYISPAEDIEVKISNFYTKVQSPVLIDLHLSFSGNVNVTKVYPHPLPDLFKDSSLTVFGRYRGAGDATVTLSGMLGDRKVEFSGQMKFVSDNQRFDFIPPLWATRRIGFLLDQIRLHGQNQELVDEITQLAREHGIVTPYTSYLILEDETRRVQSGALRERDQTLGNVAGIQPGFVGENKKEFENMAKKSGHDSIQASVELQAMNQAAALPQARQGESRMNYRGRDQELQNAAQQVRNIQGRAIYNFSDQWVDSHVQKFPNLPVNRIQFASDAYFSMLKKEPQSAQFLALGKNVRFVMNRQVYEIYE